MADHESISMLIPWYANGTLSPEERRGVEEHISGCSECRALLEDAGALADLELPEPDELLDHVQARHLERFATDRVSMEPEAEMWVQEHVERCTVCRDALLILERSAQHATAPEEKAREHLAIWNLLGRTILHPAAAASYLIIILLMIPAYRAFIDIPETGRDWGGSVDLKVLSSAMRGEQPAAILHVGPEQPVVPLGAEFELPLGISPETAIRFELSGEEEEVVWSQSIEAVDVEKNLNDSGLVTLLLPAALFPPGSYRLKVMRADAAKSRPLLDAPFEIARPAATASLR